MRIMNRVALKYTGKELWVEGTNLHTHCSRLHHPATMTHLKVRTYRTQDYEQTFRDVCVFTAYILHCWCIHFNVL